MLVGIVVAAAIGTLTGALGRHENRRTTPAGFGAGLLHGAAMPCMLPGLLLGHDAFVYAALNQGRPYKLGYTLGVNLCGAVFFGLLYRRSARPGTPSARAPFIINTTPNDRPRTPPPGPR